MPGRGTIFRVPMQTKGQRRNRRVEIAICATAIDPASSNSFPCMIRNGSVTGCKITCGHLHELPDEFLLQVPSITQTIGGKIVWRKRNSAGVAFQWDWRHYDDRRNAPKQQVSIDAVIFDQDRFPISDCQVHHATANDCRISIARDVVLPDEFLIDVRGLANPVKARVVWRSAEMAGLEFVRTGDLNQEPGAYVLRDPKTV